MTEAGEKQPEKHPSDRPPWVHLDVEGEGGKKVSVVATLNMEGETVYQGGAGNPLTLEQEATVQRLTRGKVDPGLERRIKRAEKIRENYAARTRGKK